MADQTQVKVVKCSAGKNAHDETKIQFVPSWKRLKYARRREQQQQLDLTAALTRDYTVRGAEIINEFKLLPQGEISAQQHIINLSIKLLGIADVIGRKSKKTKNKNHLELLNNFGFFLVREWSNHGRCTVEIKKKKNISFSNEPTTVCECQLTEAMKHCVTFPDFIEKGNKIKSRADAQRFVSIPIASPTTQSRGK